jgi:zinc protease
MRYITALALLLLTSALPALSQRSQKNTTDYLVLASSDVKADTEWNAVAEALRKKHKAELVYFTDAPRQALSEIQRLRPRYVAIVETPENLGRDYIIDLNKLAREVDDDIYADYLWGVVTGYDAPQAMKMVDNSTEPLVIKNAVATIMETNSAKWFDRYGYVDDHTPGLWGEKTGPAEPVTTGTVERQQVLRKFTDLYAKYDPDLVITAAHAREDALEMPFSLGWIVAREGNLFAYDIKYTKELWPLVESGKRKVYFAVGNCLIGNINHTRESMAPAWMDGGNAAVMIGYVVTTWHGRNGWGGLKYWLTTPGRNNLAQSIYLNQQDMLYQLSQWGPFFLEGDYFTPGQENPGTEAPSRKLAEVLGKRPTLDQLGFFHDRDVLAYYGDPKWDVNLQQIPQENDYTTSIKVKGGKAIVTVTTNDNFNIERMKGDGFKQEHVLDLPFSYFFPTRLKNPRLAAGQPWKVAVAEDFLLIYDPGFEPGKSYKIVLDVDR